MQKERGFSMLELLIVVAIVTLIAAIAIPNLRTARQSANAASAVQSLRTITTAQQMFKNKTQQYAILAQLAPEGTLDNSLGSGNKSNYTFTITVTADFEHFTCNATPQEDPFNLIHYFVDETSVIRYEQGTPAGATSPPIPR